MTSVLPPPAIIEDAPEPERPQVSSPRALRVALRSHEGHLGTALAVNVAATIGIRSRELGSPLRTGVLLSPFATDSWRTLSAYGDSFTAVLRRHVGAAERGGDGLKEGLRGRLASPGGLESACAAVLASSDEELTALAAGERWGMAVMPGVCTPWLGDLSREQLLALGQAMHARTISYLEDTCDVVVIAPRGDRGFDPAELPAAASDVEVVLVEANAPGAVIAAAHPAARLGVLRGTASYENYATQGELDTPALAALCGRLPAAEATLNLYQLEGGRGGGLFAAGQRGHTEERRAFMELVSTLLAPLPGLELLAASLAPEPGPLLRRGFLGRLCGTR